MHSFLTKTTPHERHQCVLKEVCGKRCPVQHLAGSPVLSLTRWAQRGARCRAWVRNIGPQPVVIPVGDLGIRGLQDKNQREGEGRRAAYLNLKFAQLTGTKRDCQTLRSAPMVSVNVVGTSLSVVCVGLAIFRATHLVCLEVRIDPNCFAASHMRLEVEWEGISNTHLVGGRGVRRGQH